jgi:hypothetical protein
MERSMRAGAGVLDDYRFQAESLACTVLLTNLHPSTLDGCPPHLLLFNKQPPLDFLKPCVTVLSWLSCGLLYPSIVYPTIASC